MKRVLPIAIIAGLVLVLLLSRPRAAMAGQRPAIVSSPDTPGGASSTQSLGQTLTRTGIGLATATVTGLANKAISAGSNALKNLLSATQPIRSAGVEAASSTLMGESSASASLPVSVGAETPIAGIGLGGEIATSIVPFAPIAPLTAEVSGLVTTVAGIGPGGEILTTTVPLAAGVEAVPIGAAAAGAEAGTSAGAATAGASIGAIVGGVLGVVGVAVTGILGAVGANAEKLAARAASNGVYTTLRERPEAALPMIAPMQAEMARLQATPGVAPALEGIHASSPLSAIPLPMLRQAMGDALFDPRRLGIWDDPTVPTHAFAVWSEWGQYFFPLYNYLQNWKVVYRRGFDPVPPRWNQDPATISWSGWILPPAFEAPGGFGNTYGPFFDVVTDSR